MTAKIHFTAPWRAEMMMRDISAFRKQVESLVWVSSSLDNRICSQQYCLWSCSSSSTINCGKWLLLSGCSIVLMLSSLQERSLRQVKWWWDFSSSSAITLICLRNKKREQPPVFVFVLSSHSPWTLFYFNLEREISCTVAQYIH